jgi:uncharacterized protein (TIGR03083 family)
MSQGHGTVAVMDSQRFLDCLAADYELLRGAAEAADLTAPVPSCPGWTMQDLVSHVGEVYLHKVAAMRTGQWPDPWPTAEMKQEAPRALLARGYDALTAEFAKHAPDEYALTWYDPDQTVGFWIRRMAQETVIHRMDAQLAAGVPLTAAPDDLAADGIDELLKCFLAYSATNWPEEFAKLEGGHLTAQNGPGTIVVATGERGWTLRPEPDKVTVDDGTSESAQVVITAPPDRLLRWLWGRAGDDVVTATGDLEWATYLRRMLVETTQ